MAYRHLTILISATISLVLLSACSEKSPEENSVRCNEYLTSGNADSATVELKNAIQLNADNGQAHFELAKVHLENHRYDSAKNEFLSASENDYDLSEIIPLLLKTMYLQRDYEGILKLNYDNSYINESDRPQVSYYYFYSLLEQDEKEEAEILAQGALERLSKGMYLSLIVIHLDIIKGHNEDALAKVETLCQQYPSEPLVRELLTRLRS